MTLSSRSDRGRYRIGLAALLGAWAVVVLWFSWARVVINVLDDEERHERAMEMADDQPLSAILQQQ